MENRGRKLQTLSANWKLIFDWMDELLRLIELSESLWQAFDLIWFRLFILFLLQPKFKILFAHGVEQSTLHVKGRITVRQISSSTGFYSVLVSLHTIDNVLSCLV